MGQLKNLRAHTISNYFCNVGQFFEIMISETMWCRPMRCTSVYVCMCVCVCAHRKKSTNKQWIAATVPINGSQTLSLAAKRQFYFIVANNSRMHRFVVLAVWRQFIEIQVKRRSFISQMLNGSLSICSTLTRSLARSLVRIRNFGLCCWCWFFSSFKFKIR